jgi:hypothetical protein
MKLCALWEGRGKKGWGSRDWERKGGEEGRGAKNGRGQDLTGPQYNSKALTIFKFKSSHYMFKVIMINVKLSTDQFNNLLGSTTTKNTK